MIFFRADSNEIIAGGHIMRCMAIADALIEAGEQVCFLIADDNPAPLLEGAGLSYIVLHSNWQDLMTDIDKTIMYVSEYDNPLVIIDTYSVNREYVKILKRYSKVGYLGSKKENLGQLDILINYSANIDYDFYENNYDKKTELLLGVEFAPLRKEFRNYNPVYNKSTKKVLLTTGNTNRDCIVQQILKRVNDYIIEYDIELDVVIGRLFKDREDIYDEYSSKEQINLLENVASMSELMKDVDLAISANGTTIYELAAIGIPTISFSMVDEQLDSANALNNKGVINYCGESYIDALECADKIANRLEYYLNNDVERIALGKHAHNLMDGNGCIRIVDSLKRII